MLTNAFITPHPPIIIPDIGRKEDLITTKNTISALEKLNTLVVQSEPETIVLVSPHAPLFPKHFSISATHIFSGDFQQFGEFKNYFEFKNDTEITEKIHESAQAANLPVKLIPNATLDHGALVPLYYLAKNRPKTKLVLVSFSYRDLDMHFKFGQIIHRVIQNSSKRIAFVASGDLSHRLISSAPAGFHPDGKKFDKILISFLQRKQAKEIIKLDSQFIENAGECGLRSIVILLGVLSGLRYTPEILSYEGPFGVGYLVANFTLNG